jgi:hypothetical protein
LPHSGGMTEPVPPARRTALDVVATAMRGDHRQAHVLLGMAENLPAVADALVQLAAARAADVRLDDGSARPERTGQPSAGLEPAGKCPEPERAAMAVIAAYLAGDNQGAQQLLATADAVVPVDGCLVTMAGQLLLAGSSDPGERARVAELLRESLRQSAA